MAIQATSTTNTAAATIFMFTSRAPKAIEVEVMGRVSGASGLTALNNAELVRRPIA